MSFKGKSNCRRTADTRKRRNPEENNCCEFTHAWAETAVRNIKCLAGFLTWQRKRADQLTFLSQSVRDVVDSFAVLKTRKDHFDFDFFSDAIDEPACAFDYDDESASYHAAVEDLVHSFVLAMFPKKDPSQITSQDVEPCDAADIKRIAAALSDTTGHELKDTIERLSRLAAGVAKEYAIKRSAAHIAEQLVDSKTDNEQGLCVVCLDPPYITIKGVPHPLNKTAAILLDAISNAEDWVSGSTVVNQPSRVVAHLPDQVRKLIQSAPGKGFRLRRKE